MNNGESNSCNYEEAIALSIIVPVYNSEIHLHECIRSILAQSYRTYELILVDDGSTDESRSICTTYEQNDKRVRYFFQDNSGVSAARNSGIMRAQGKYLMFVDSDDILPPDAIDVLMKEPIYDFVMGGYAEFSDATDLLVKEYKCKAFSGSKKSFLCSISDYLSPPFLYGPCFKLFKRELVTNNQVEFPINMSYGEDAIFVIHYLKCISSAKCIDANLYFYRKSNKLSLSSTFRDDKLDINVYIAKEIIALLNENKISNEKLYDQCVVRFFDDYTNELFSSKSPYSACKKIFYHKARKYAVEMKYSSLATINFRQLLRRRAIQSNSWFFILFIAYRLRYALDRLRESRRSK